MRTWTEDELWIRTEYPEQVEEIVRRAKVEAYEESAKIAESWSTGNNGDATEEIANEIRALKE